MACRGEHEKTLLARLEQVKQRFYFGKICAKHPELNGWRTISGCRICASEQAKSRYIANGEAIRSRVLRHYYAEPEAHMARSLAWHRANPDKKSLINKRWRESHLDLSLKIVSDWKKANPGKRNASLAKYRAQLLKATPVWADHDKIEAIYAISSAYIAAGIPCEVDHIVPLRSKQVCGLHCEANLQLLDPLMNRVKGNRWWPDMTGAHHGS